MNFSGAARHFLSILASSCILALSAASAYSQMPDSSSTTSTPIPGAGHDYLGEIGETVNPANGSISIRISGMMPPGRRLSIPFSFAYDSGGINYVSRGLSGGPTWQNPSNTIVSTGGWSETAPVVSANELTWTAITSEGRNEGCFGFVDYVFQDPEGNRHNLNLTNYKGNTSSDACTYDSADWPLEFSGEVVTQSGEDGWNPARGAITAAIPTNGLSVGPVTVTEPNGTAFYFPNYAQDGYGSMATSVEDTNGNLIVITPPSSTSAGYSYSDTTGRTVLTDSGVAASPENVTIAGLNAPYTLQ